MRSIKHIVSAVIFTAGISAGAYFLLTGQSVQAVETGGQESLQAKPVKIVTMTPEKIQLWKKFSGHLVAVDRADIRPQVSGRINEVRFEDGQHVNKGDVLMVIDTRPYEAALNQAKAALDAAITQADLAEKEYKRAKELIKKQAIAQRLLDERLNNRRSAAAAVKAAESEVEKAEINLDHAYVKAPIAGKVSRAELTEGNLVEAGNNAPVLTSIVADENIYVDFEVDERTYLRSVRRHEKNDDKIPVRMTVGEVTYEGDVHSFDNHIDPASGTIRARALFENTDKILLPGMSVTVNMGANGDEAYLFVPERAIGTDQDRKFVYVVDNGLTAYRKVTIGESIDGRRIVTSGLSAGDKVVAEGIMKIQPGMAVVAKETDVAVPSDAAAPEEK